MSGMLPDGPAPLVDAVARDRIRHDIATTFVVEAAAGTGKTTELVHRMVSVVEANGRLAHMVAVTFTEKAAGELRLRLRGRLEERLLAVRGGDPDVSRRLEVAIAELEVAHIGTIHSLCSDILRERPIEARVDPQFEVAGDTGSMHRMYGGAFDAWFQAVLSDPPEGVRRLLRMRDPSGPRELLHRAGLSLVEHRDHPAAWRRDPWDRAQAIASVRDQLRMLAAIHVGADEAHDPLAEALGQLAFVLADLDRTTDLDRIENELRYLARHSLWKRDGFKRTKTFSKVLGLSRADVLAARDRAKAIVEAFAQASEHDLAALLREELRGIVTAYDAVKDEAGVLDFVDLLLGTRDLIVSSASVRQELQERFTHLFVDEFQDTDPLQAEILLLLAADDPSVTEWKKARPVPGKLFVVGDPKQSIYRFRRADVRLYEEVKQALVAHGAESLHLQTSFRSRPAIQALINNAYAPVMTGAPDGSQARYVGLEAFRPERDDIPALVALPIPGAYNAYGRPAYYRMEQSFPLAVAAWVDWLLTRSGWKVEHEGLLVPVESRHVCLLLRRFQKSGDDLTRAYTDALEAKGVPHVLVGGSAYHAREEVAALRTVLVAIEWPDDELHVYGALKGPLFGHTDESLFLFRGRHGSLHPLKDQGALAGDPVADTLVLLGQLHMLRNGRPLAETIVALLEATRAQAGFADWPNGEQTLANVLKLVEVAQSFESRGATSFRLFVEELLHEAKEGGAPDAPIVEEGTDGVRIMTVHKAKGLEFPVVVLCDPTANLETPWFSHFADGERGLWLERLAGCSPKELLEMETVVRAHDRHENVRLSYVAATRARDVLVLPTLDRGGLEDSWVSILEPPIRPAPRDRQVYEPGPGCPATPQGTWTAPHHDETAPGLHRVAGPHGVVPVVHWDLSTLDLKGTKKPGLREVDFLRKPEAEEPAIGSTAELPLPPPPDDGLAAYQAWKASQAELRSRAATPTRIARSVTELVKERGPVGRTGIAHERVSLRTFRRPTGTGFGILVHAILAEVPLEADGEVISRFATAQARLQGASEDEREAAIEAVTEALRHPVIGRARAASEVRREVPLAIRLPDGVIAEGVVDLAFRVSAGEGGLDWVVVDFKTDENPELLKEQYERQVALYMFAIKKATGAGVTGVLLTV